MADHTTASLIENLQKSYDHALAIKQEALDEEARRKALVRQIAEVLTDYRNELMVLMAQHPHLYAVPYQHMDAGLAPDGRALFQYGSVSVAFQVSDLEGVEGVEYAGPTAFQRNAPYSEFITPKPDTPEGIRDEVRKIINNCLVKGITYDPKKI